MLEALILYVCIHGQPGCSESTAAYYKHNKEAQYLVTNVKEQAKQLAKRNEWIVYAATPMYAMAAGKPAKIKVYKGLILKLDVKDPGVALEWTF